MALQFHTWYGRFTAFLNAILCMKVDVNGYAWIHKANFKYQYTAMQIILGAPFCMQIKDIIGFMDVHDRISYVTGCTDVYTVVNDKWNVL